MKRELSETVRFFLFFRDRHIVCFNRQSPLSVFYRVSKSSCCRSFSCVREESTDVIYRCIHLAVLTRLCVTSLPLITILRVVPASVRVRVCVIGFSIPSFFSPLTVISCTEIEH